MSDSADCFAATAVRPDGQGPSDRLATDLESAIGLSTRPKPTAARWSSACFERPIRRKTGSAASTDKTRSRLDLLAAYLTE
ncbi:MAG: hypothetical protein ACI91B_003950 [Planctomycetota bacterium]|jgi:hypothetical protein